MRKLMIWGTVVALLAIASPAWSETAAPRRASDNPTGCCCQPARFQIFHATGRYGGLIMLDTKTGESYQRVIVNTTSGISIKWMKLERVPKITEQQTIVWD